MKITLNGEHVLAKKTKQQQKQKKNITAYIYIN